MKVTKLSPAAQLAIFANGLARQTGININFAEGMHPSCGVLPDGKMVVNMPAIPSDLSQEDAEKFRGVMLHEVMHYTDTDFSVVRGLSPLEKSLENIFEDIRIERLAAARYPGGQKLLAATVRRLTQEGWFGDPKGDEAAVNVLTGYLLHHMRAEYLGQPLQPQARLWRKALETTFPADVVKGLDAIVHKASSMATTSDAVSLAREVVALLEQAVEEDQDQSQQPEAAENADKQSDDQSQQQGQQQPSSASAPEDPEDGESEGAEGGDSLSPSQEENDGESPIEAEGGVAGLEAVRAVLEASEGEIRETDLSAALGELAETHSKEYLSTARYKDTRLSEAPVDMALYREGRTAAKGLANKLKQLLRGKAPRVSYRSAYTGKRLARQAGVYAAAGTTAPAYRTKDVRGRATGYDVHILVDYSGSMEGESISIAIKSAIALAHGIEDIENVRCAVSGFTQTKLKSGEWVNHFLIKGYGESVRAVVGMCAYNWLSMGYTPLAEGILGAMAYMEERTRDQEQILFVITDGEPDSVASSNKALEQARQAGIRTFGIGICEPSVKSLAFGSSVVINSAEELSTTLFRELRRLLR